MSDSNIVVAESSDLPFQIIARKPRGSGNDDIEYIVVDRGPAFEHASRWVSATASAASLRHKEWFWGHYFCTREEAMAHFNNRG